MFLLSLMPKLFEYDPYHGDYSSNDDLFAFILILFFIFIFLVCIAAIVIRTISFWKIFKKAGKEGWECLIPIYSNWVWFEISGIPGWWSIIILFLAFIPYLGSFLIYVFYCLVYINMAAKFKKEAGFTVLLVFLPIVGLPMLAFGKDKYHAKVAPVINLGSVSDTSANNEYNQYKQNNNNYNNVNRATKIKCNSCGFIEEGDAKYCSSCGKEIK